MFQLIWPASLFCLQALAFTTNERFDEKLTINTLQDGKVASKFTFTTLLKGVSPRNPMTLDEEDECEVPLLISQIDNRLNRQTAQHYTLFPLSLGQILREYAVTELHLSLNAGNWNYDRWGYPEESGVATGAELWAWMGDGSSQT